MARHLIRTLIPFALLASMTACSVVGGGGASTEDVGPSYPQIAGPWMGALQIEGDGFNSMLEVEQIGPVLRLVIEIPALDLVTRGMGNILPDGTLRASFMYELECPGEAQFIGEASADGEMVLSGTLLASDCTGDLRGTFRYTR
ncbi:MAG TPA: hypothetical protein VKA74_19825 [Myxococcota bacterium]|nr:hypothetical protein [Myxococcota bacterium]